MAAANVPPVVPLAGVAVPAIAGPIPNPVLDSRHQRLLDKNL